MGEKFIPLFLWVTLHSMDIPIYPLNSLPYHDSVEILVAVLFIPRTC